MPIRQLVNKRTGAVLVRELEVANNPISRMVGLLGRKGLEPGQGLLITACHSIHMFFMRFAIDVVYLSKDLQVLKCTRNLREFRLDSGPSGTYQTLEIKSGSIDGMDLKCGDSLEIRNI